jgi:hypothetical protein
MGLNATARTFGVSKKSVIDWEWRLGRLKSTLMIYSLMHTFIHQVIEGDELYTKVAQNRTASESEGWTIVLMERASRFLWELQCGRKDKQLFTQALTTLAEVIKQTDSLTLLSDGERRYGNLLFEICHEVIRNGQLGRPPKRLKLGVREYGSKIKGLKNALGANAASIKLLSLKILKLNMRLKNLTSMPIMLRLSMLLCDDETRLFVVKLTHTLNRKATFRELLTFFG